MSLYKKVNTKEKSFAVHLVSPTQTKAGSRKSFAMNGSNYTDFLLKKEILHAHFGYAIDCLEVV